MYDNLDFQRGVDVFLNAQSAPSFLMNIQGMRSIGIDDHTDGIFEGRVDSKKPRINLNTQHSTLNTQHSTLNTQHSTLNTQTVSLAAQPDMRNGPVVVVIPPKVQGLADDAWMRCIVDMGMVGPDKGQQTAFYNTTTGVTPAMAHDGWARVRGTL
ncbi:DUF1254 domain-containing protein [Pseudomonas sp. PMCC200344]|uniref:DUF1254 domain-containing protein n=1 Tax=Pseudomonas sp. PMCC200344 TaxID=3042028 RepID=UPI0024B3344E|nr:DUF1254 domain-containing protein [Pseudomonas sp. PMCC200344]